MATAVEASDDLSLPADPPRRAWGMGERMVLSELGTDGASLRIKQVLLSRYTLASQCVAGRRALDIACGCGYGTEILGRAAAREVVGVDLSERAIAIARRDHAGPNVSFFVGNAEIFAAEQPFDVICSLETIEHLERPADFLTRLRTLIDDDGDLFVSVPIGETRDLDPYHLHKFEEPEFLDMLRAAGFQIVHRQVDVITIRPRHFLAWGRSYPAEQPTLRELLLTKRGLGFLARILRGWGYHLPCLLVHARPT